VSDNIKIIIMILAMIPVTLWLKKMFEKLECKESKTSSLKSESEESVKDDKN